MWSSWLFLGGRGAGKTRAGAEWLNDRATPGARLNAASFLTDEERRRMAGVAG